MGRKGVKRYLTISETRFLEKDGIGENSEVQLGQVRDDGRRKHCRVASKRTQEDDCEFFKCASGNYLQTQGHQILKAHGDALTKSPKSGQ